MLGLLSCESKKSGDEKEGQVAVNTVPTLETVYAGFYPHDVNAFTEGLQYYNGQLFESTGSPKSLSNTRSLFGVVNMETGEIDVKVELDKRQFFGEGICILNDKLYQLTYKSRVGFIYDFNTFEELGRFQIPGQEGWGLTSDNNDLFMSDGTSYLKVLDPESLKVKKTIGVMQNGVPRDSLNELEYINGFVYANIWLSNKIVKIDPASGEVKGILKFDAFAQEAKAINPKAQEMNGIAYNPETKKMLITGKMWPKIYEVTLLDK